jgi:hypothetical protein
MKQKNKSMKLNYYPRKSLWDATKSPEYGWPGHGNGGWARRSDLPPHVPLACVAAPEDGRTRFGSGCAIPRRVQFLTTFATGPLVALLACYLWLAGWAPSALGAEVFTVNTAQSYVSISGRVVGQPLHEQRAGSLTTRYSGTLIAEVGSDTIQFPGQCQVAAMDNGSWEPLSDGSEGSETANYGGTASYFLTTGVAAIRQVQLDVTSGVVAVANGQFDTEHLTFSIPGDAGCSLAYRVEGGYNDSGVIALDGKSTTGQQAMASLTTEGSQLVLTIPINYTMYFSLLDDNDTTVTLAGQLVASRSL